MHQKRVSKGVWVWGQFDNASTEQITRLHNAANEMLNGPSFDVHLTLSGPILDLESNYQSKLNDLSKTLSCIEIKLDGIGMKDQFYQSLFLNLKENLTLKNLKTQIDSKLNLDKDNFFPHISLYYGNAREKSKLRFLDELRLPEKALLDTISIVKVDEEIKSWKVLRSFSLRTNKENLYNF